MGICSSKDWSHNQEAWEQKMIFHEGHVLRCAGFNEGECEREFTTIEMDGAPFKVRTFYMGRNDKEKKTLVFTHGQFMNVIAYSRLLVLLSKKYRLVCFDHSNFGLNTRSTKHHTTAEEGEQWVSDFVTRLVEKLDVPDKFYLAGHSYGGWWASKMAGLLPERIESMFLLSPAGTHTYDPETYDQYGYISMGGGINLAPKKEVDDFVKSRTERLHPFHGIHDMAACPQNMILSMIAGSSTEHLAKGGLSKEGIKHFEPYNKLQFEYHGEAEITVATPFMYPLALLHSLTKEDRLNKPECNFPIAIAFGDRDMFASSNGAEDILNNAKKHNGGMVNLFKVPDAEHNFSLTHCDYVFEKMTGHFDGTITNTWEPTIYGDYNWQGKTPTKGWKPIAEQRKELK